MSEAISNKRATLSAADWEQEALKMIAERGVGALGVEPLARRMGITKGSFYWHFANRDALLAQALNRWEAHDARNLAASLTEINNPRDRLISFFRGSTRQGLTHEVYSALLAASEHPQVEPVLERVAERRMQQIAEAFSALGFDRLRARHRAQLTYSAYLGFLQLQRQHQTPSPSSEGFEAYVEHVIETLIPRSA